MSQVALITGGGGGIGGAVARRMAAAGIAVIIADYDGGAAEQVKGEIAAAGGKADALAIDVTVAREVKAVVTDVAKRYGRVDILANIAGGMRLETAWRPLREMDPNDWDFVFRQNVRWVQLLSCAVSDVMVSQGTGGSVISIGSVSGIFGAANHAAYGSAKAGLIHLMRSLALEYGRYGVRFNTVSPGSIRTPGVGSRRTRPCSPTVTPASSRRARATASRRSAWQT